jgi:hypothetical protein
MAAQQTSNQNQIVTATLHGSVADARSGESIAKVKVVISVRILSATDRRKRGIHNPERSDWSNDLYITTLTMVW